MSKFYAEGMAVRFSNGKPCCVTSGSTHLETEGCDPKDGRKMREGMAHLIAKALNEYFQRSLPTPTK